MKRFAKWFVLTMIILTGLRLLVSEKGEGILGVDSSQAITKLYFQHWATSNPEVIQNFSPLYSALINATYNTDSYIPGKTNEMLGQYVEATTAMPLGAHDPGYPVIYEDIKQNELTFVHSADPAELTTVYGGDYVGIYWKYDERYPANYSGLTYNIYRLSNANLDDKKLWDQQWKNYSWTKIASVNASGFGVGTSDVGKFLSYPDKSFPTSGKTCYIIKTVTGATDSFYSLPDCKDYSTEVSPGYYYYTHSDIKLINKTPIDNYYSNNTYSIKVLMQKWADFSNAEVVVYGNENNNGKGTKITDNQYAYNFHEVASYPVTINSANRIEATITLKRPYLLYKGGRNGGYTEEPAFRIRANYNGLIKYFPTDGGYLTTWENNKLSQRFWTGFPANPASAEWQSKMIDVIKAMQSKGYNTVFLDNWMPRLFDINSAGTSFEAPAREFYYPDNWQSISGFVDPTVLAFDKLGTAMKTAVPGFTLLGNSLNSDPNSPRVLQSIDMGMYEACIHTGVGRAMGDELVKTYTVIESALNQGKKVVCFSTFSDGGQGVVSIFDPEHRIYTMAAFLQVTQNKTNGKAYYGHAEHSPNWGSDVNQYPEYSVDIGNPIKSRESLGSYYWRREFDNAWVYVNAGASTVNFSLPIDSYKMIISGVAIARDSNGKITSADPGNVSFQKITTGTSISLAPGNGVILLKSLPVTVVPTATNTPTRAPTVTPVATNTPTRMPTLAPTATNTPTMVPTATITPTRAPTVTPIATNTPTRMPTVTPTRAPTATITPTRAPTVTPMATSIPTNVKLPTSTPISLPTKTPLPGDSNDDGSVNLTDFAIWKDEYLNKTGLNSDFDKNGVVDLADYAIWKKAYLGT